MEPLPAPPAPPTASTATTSRRKRYDFIRNLTAALPHHPEIKNFETVGFQPWQVEEVWQRLKADMRQYRNLTAAHEDTAPVQLAILYDAGWLGHYVGDGSQPLHNTIQYNGWTGPNPHGYTTEHHIHAQFESVYVSANIKASDVAPLVAAAQPTVIDDEWGQYWNYLHHSNSLVEKVYQLDKKEASPAPEPPKPSPSPRSASPPEPSNSATSSTPPGSTPPTPSRNTTAPSSSCQFSALSCQFSVLSSQF